MTRQTEFSVQEIFMELRRWLADDALAFHRTALNAGSNESTVDFLRQKIAALPSGVTSAPLSPEEEVAKVQMVATLNNDHSSLRARYARWQQMVDFLSWQAGVELP